MSRVQLCVLLILAGSSVAAATANDWKVDLNARVRFESREQTYTFNRKVSSVTDDSWWVTRFRAGLKGDLAPAVASYVQLQDSREFGSRRSAVPFISGSEGDDPLDLRQAYVEFKVAEGVWRVGRQLLVMGEERLVGVSDWNNFARSFDAVRASWPGIGGGLDVFVSSVVRVQPGAHAGWHSNHSSRDDFFAGVYSRFAPATTLKLEPYLLGRRARKEVVYNAGAAGSSRPYDIPQEIGTAGLRLIGGPPEKLGGFDYDIDFALQYGRIRGRQLVGTTFAYPGPAWLDHRAAAFHGGLGYRVKLASAPVRFYAEANRASGDRNPTDGRSESFINHFPSNHRFYGRMDLFSWKNLREFALSAATTLRQTRARIEQHWFALDNVNDTWFRSNGTTMVRPLTAAARQAARRAGRETDLVLSHAFGQRTTVDLGFSYFAAGPYLVATGGASDAHLAYLQATWQW